MKHSDQLTQHYLRREYPPELLAKHRQKTNKIDRGSLLGKKPEPTPTASTTNPRIPFVLTYNPHNPNINKIVMTAWPLLLHSQVASDLYTTPPIFAYRRCTNLRDNLMTAKIRYPVTHAGTHGKTIRNPPMECHRHPCTICKLLDKDQTVSATSNQRYFSISKRASQATCEDGNLIYLITCTLCRKQYVGETKRTLRTRIKEHLVDIKHQRDTPVASHFNQRKHKLSHVTTKVLEIFPFETNSDTGTDIRKRNEKSWIYRLRCLHPHGINIYT